MNILRVYKNSKIKIFSLKFLFYICILFSIQSEALASVAFFYGKYPPASELCTHKMIVVIPYSEFKPDSCGYLSEVIAYVSVGEVEYNSSYKDDISPKWVLGENAAWNHNLIVDQTNPEWHDFFLDKLIEPLWQQGYRGFFLDTLDSFFLVSPNKTIEQQQINGLATLIRKIKIRHPEAKIILNRGFQILPSIYKEVNAVVIESLYNAWNQAKTSYELTSKSDQKMLFEQITKIRQMNLPIIIIDYIPPSKKNEAPKISKNLRNQGFIPWITNKDVDAIYIQKLKPVSREILILYSNKKKQDIMFIPAVKYLGKILEYMGYIPIYVDVTALKTLPKDNLKDKYAGIILWLDTQNTRAVRILNWVKIQIQRQIPIVFIGGFGIPPEAQYLSKLNLQVNPIKDSNASLTINKTNSKFVGYEASIPKMPYYFFPLKTTNSQVLLQVNNEYNQTEDAIALTPWGGFVLYPYVIKFLPNDQAKWIVNPFEFLKSALQLENNPVPDISTENGRRLMFIHIDGDGFTYKARWLNGRSSGEELRDKIFKKYQFPTSVSVITGEFAPQGIINKSAKKMINVARDIFQIPWVEMASHSYSHPFNWQQQKTEYEKLKSEGIYGLNIPNYKMDLNTEIIGSINFINKYLAPNHKQAKLFFWTGLGNPSESALEIINKNHLLAINGLGSNISDKENTSLANIRPMGIKIGNNFQILASFPMDFKYIRGFMGPLYGFESVIENAKTTENPVRLNPVDLYYHFYAGTYSATLKTLIKIYNWLETQNFFHIYTSEYIEKVLDFYKIKLAKWNDAWLISSAGNLHEIRSPKTLGYPNLLKSKNIVGYKPHKNDLYIHLGPAKITLLKYQKDKPKEPYLIDANGWVTKYARTSSDTFYIKLESYLPLEFTLGNINKCHVTSSKLLQLNQVQMQYKRYSSREKCIEIHINCQK